MIHVHAEVARNTNNVVVEMHKNDTSKRTKKEVIL